MSNVSLSTKKEMLALALEELDFLAAFWSHRWSETGREKGADDEGGDHVDLVFVPIHVDWTAAESGSEDEGVVLQSMESRFSGRLANGTLVNERDILEVWAEIRDTEIEY